MDPSANIRQAVTQLSAANAAVVGESWDHADALLERTEELVHEVRMHVSDQRLTQLAQSE